MSETVVVLEPITEVVTLTETEVVVSTSDATELVEVGLPGPQGIEGLEGPLAVSKNGTLVGSRMALNLIEGDNTTLVVADDGTEIDVTVNSTGGGGGVTAHSALTGLTSGDDHTQYQKESEKGAVSGYASLDAGGTVPDAQIPAAVARDAEVTSAIGTHTALGDAHHAAAHAVNGANHTGTLDDAQIPSGITRDTELTAHADDTTAIHGITDTGVLATDAEVATAVSDHAGAANPHPTYETSAEGQAKVDAHDADTSVHGIADTTALATDAELAAHEADTTSIHGIANTANLETASGAQAKVDVHTSDASDAHDASAVSVVPFGSIAATDVQAALEEVYDEASGGVSDHGALTGLADDDHPQYDTSAEAQAKVDVHTSDAVDAHDASAVSVVPAGGIASTNVQGALEELDGEKSASAHTHTHAATTGQTADQHHTEAHALNAGTHTGDLDDSQLSANVPLKNAENTFTNKQAITGAADEVQLSIKNHSAQTANPFEVLSNDGTVALARLWMLAGAVPIWLVEGFNTQALLDMIGHSNTASADPGVHMARSRGTATSMADVQSGDLLGHVNVEGRLSGAWLTTGVMGWVVDGTPGAGVPARVGIKLTNAAGTLTEWLRIDSAGLVTVYGSQTVVGTLTATGALILPNSTSAAPTAEASMAWDSDDDALKVGTGSSTKTMSDTTHTHAGGVAINRLFKVGRWYPGASYGDSGATTVLDQLCLIKFDCGETHSFDQIICSVTATGTSGAVVRMGVFTTDADGLPSTLVAGSEGTIDSNAATGYIPYTFASPISLSAGRYWLGLCSQTATCGLRSSTIGGGDGEALSMAGSYDLRAVAWVDTGITGGFPSPPVLDATITQAPICFLRAS